MCKPFMLISMHSLVYGISMLLVGVEPSIPITYNDLSSCHTIHAKRKSVKEDPFSLFCFKNQLCEKLIFSVAIQYVYRCKEYRAPRIKRPSAHRTRYYCSVCQGHALLRVRLWKGDSLLWGTANVLTPVRCETFLKRNIATSTDDDNCL